MHKIAIQCTALFIIFFSPTVFSDDFIWAPKFNVGDRFPQFTLNDQDGVEQTNSSISGENGYLVQFNRSVVW